MEKNIGLLVTELQKLNFLKENIEINKNKVICRIFERRIGFEELKTLESKIKEAGYSGFKINIFESGLDSLKVEINTT